MTNSINENPKAGLAVQLPVWQVTLHLYSTTVCISLGAMGCTHYPLTQLWMNLRVLAEEKTNQQTKKQLTDSHFPCPLQNNWQTLTSPVLYKTTDRLSLLLSSTKQLTDSPFPCPLQNNWQTLTSPVLYKTTDRLSLLLSSTKQLTLSLPLSSTKHLTDSHFPSPLQNNWQTLTSPVLYKTTDRLSLPLSST